MGDPLSKAQDLQPVRPVNVYCTEKRDRADVLWLACARECGFAVRADFAFDPLSAIKVHFTISHLPIDYRR